MGNGSSIVRSLESVYCDGLVFRCFKYKVHVATLVWILNVALQQHVS